MTERDRGSNPKTGLPQVQDWSPKAAMGAAVRVACDLELDKPVGCCSYPLCDCQKFPRAIATAIETYQAGAAVAGAEQGTGNPVEPQPSPTPEEGIVERLRAAVISLEALRRQGEDYIWRPAVKVSAVLNDAADFIEASLRSSSERERMREALRDHVIEGYDDHGQRMERCLHCDGAWVRLQSEMHKPDCPAALSERGTGE